MAAVVATASLSTCGVVIHDDVPDGQLDGTVTVDWASQDLFIYRPENKPLWFRPDFMNKNEQIKPVAMYTDGGSIPRFFWNIPGLSPWGFGPAYVIHDYIFKVHRCGWPDPVVAKITFEQSALVLAEVGKALIAHGLIRDDALNAIVWGVRTRYARDLWHTPGTAEPKEYCEIPGPRLKGETRVMQFAIPPRQR